MPQAEPLPSAGAFVPRPPQDPYLQAGLVYGVLGAVVLLLTVAAPEMVRPERRGDLLHLLVGMPFFVVFALAIAGGDRLIAALLVRRGRPVERAWAAGRWFREKLVMLMAVTALVRTVVFGANGLGYRPRWGVAPWRFALENASPEPRMLMAALLMATIFAFLFRASWKPFLARCLGRKAPP